MAKIIRRILNSKLLKISAALIVLLILAIPISNYIVIHSSEDKLFSNIDSIPLRKVGLVLGANKNAFGGKNLFFEYRINAAAQLFKAGKINHIIVSGDNHIKWYD